MRLRALPVLLLFSTCTAPAMAADAVAEPPAAPARAAAERPPPDPQMQLLGRKIMYGQATLAEVRKALTDPDIGELTNTVHGLYSMRWHRGVQSLLVDLWTLQRERWPEINWRQFEKPPVRLALAGTLIRVQPFDNAEYVEYLRAHRFDEHEFHRAQVVIGLGFKAAAEDVDYIYDMANGDNPFVAQSAITALGLMNQSTARSALLKLRDVRAGDARVRIVEEVLQRAYDWRPETATAAPARP